MKPNPVLNESPDGRNTLVKHPEDFNSGSWKRFTIEHIQSGQIRPYADSVYEAIITIEGGTPSSVKGYDVPFRGQKSIAKEIAKMFVHDFVEEAEWWQPKLETIELIEDHQTYSQWRVVIRQIYLD